ncbi:reverse transcriptase-like protein [Endothiovibrio diazotrophicus]
METKYTFIANASHDEKNKITGIGMALHQADKPKRNGVLIEEIKEAYDGIPNKIIELFAIYRALEIARERNYQIVRVRSDYNLIRTKLKEGYEQHIGFEREDLHGEILRMTSDFKLIQFSYKPRRKNQMARQLAREARTLNSPIRRTDLDSIFAVYEQ